MNVKAAGAAHGHRRIRRRLIGPALCVLGLAAAVAAVLSPAGKPPGNPASAAFPPFPAAPTSISRSTSPATPTPLPTPSSTPSSSLAPTVSASPLPPSPSSAPTVTVTSVTSLAITLFGYDSRRSTSAQTVVSVTTDGPGQVAVTLQYDGSDNANQPGQYSPVTDQFIVQGKTSYTIVDHIDSSQFCYYRYWGVMVDSNPPPPEMPYLQLQSSRC